MAVRSVGELFDLQLIWLRLAIAALAALLFALLGWLSRQEPRRSFGRARGVALGLLGVLALAAFSANYNLFLWPRLHGIHTHDVFHYYVGAKYFPELGYFDLYRCSLAVEGQTTPNARAAAAAVESDTPVRDLRAQRLATAAELRPAGARCDGRFEAGRWASFERDVRWFQSRLRARKWKNVLADHGFNPSPVWTLFGRPLAEAVPAESRAMRWVVRIDMLLLLAAFAAVGRVFGFSGLCMVVIAWGTNPLSRYQWVGDAFLRFPWWAASLFGLCFLKQRRSSVAGGFLALASLLRLFPVFQLVCVAVHAVREGWPQRAIRPQAVRLAAGATVTAVVLALAGLALNGRGFAAYQEFAENIVPHSEILAWSSVGLVPLLGFSPLDGSAKGAAVTEEDIQRAKLARVESRWYLHWPLLALFGVLLFRALGRCEAWEAAALGVVPALLLTSMVSYYVAAVAPLGLLAARRPRIGIALMLALVAWCASAIAFYSERLEFVVSSAIALVFVFYALLEMQWPAAAAPGAATSQPENGPENELGNGSARDG